MEDQNPSKFEKESYKQPVIVVGNIYSHIIAQEMVVNDTIFISYRYITFVSTNIF
jgi:hypothetical protein